MCIANIKICCHYHVVDPSTGKFLKMSLKAQRSFIEILYFCEIFDQQLMKSLALHCHAVDKALCSYILDILFDRYYAHI